MVFAGWLLALAELVAHPGDRLDVRTAVRREAELLPVPYLHLVFKLPAALGAIAYQNKAKVYGLLLKAAAETLITIAADREHLGANIGVTTVLHTWGQNLQQHPHS